MEIKTGEQILQEAQLEKIVEIIKENNCPQDFGLLECRCGTHEAAGLDSCRLGWDDALSLNYEVQGNGVYVPVEDKEIWRVAGVGDTHEPKEADHA